MSFWGAFTRLAPFPTCVCGVILQYSKSSEKFFHKKLKIHENSSEFLLPSLTKFLTVQQKRSAKKLKLTSNYSRPLNVFFLTQNKWEATELAISAGSLPNVERMFTITCIHTCYLHMLRAAFALPVCNEAGKEAGMGPSTNNDRTRSLSNHLLAGWRSQIRITTVGRISFGAMPFHCLRFRRIQP